MRRKKKYFRYTKERVLLSDILPYEIPITFSNRHIYHFYITYGIHQEGDYIIIKKVNDVVCALVKLLLGIENSRSVDSRGRIALKCKNSIPFGYKIIHNENDFRELTLIHPKNQLSVVDFYHSFKELILYYSSISPFSIRKPYRVAKYKYYKDKFHVERLDKKNDGLIEQHDKEYENLKTFFAYKKYSNIYKFYESYEYHRSEKKYNKLLKFDITKCFDSIYTHSILWALFNKSVVKKHLKSKKKTFGNLFDELMMNLNYDETNGIVIGPEFSRIFAELILQKVDLEVKNELDKEGYLMDVDYKVYRYVDDYFLFYNEDTLKEKALTLFRLKLREYKLYLNDSKLESFDKPIITSITIAKQKINEILNNNLKYTIEESKIDNPDESKSKTLLKGSFVINSNKLITKFKTIISESRIKYKDILNYTFAILERKLKKIIIDYFRIEKDDKSEKVFILGLLEFLEFIFFLYLVSPRVNTTIRLCRILRLITETFNLKDKFDKDLKHLLYKKIYDNIFLVLQKNKTLAHTQVETIYLLIALKEIGKEYWLTQDVLSSYLGVDKNKDMNYKCKTELNYFTLIVSLFYMENKIRYKKLKEFILRELENKFRKHDYAYRLKKAELILLLFDILACPYVDNNFKKNILSLYEIKDSLLQEKIINFQMCWFTKWLNFDFGLELDAKISQEVY